MFQRRGRAIVFKENQSVFMKDSDYYLGWNQFRFWKGFRLLFGKESVQVLERIQAAIREPKYATLVLQTPIAYIPSREED